MSELVTDRKGQLMLFIVMAMAFFLDGLDGTIVTIALPEIGRTFGMTTSESSWIVTIYFMIMAGLILVFGKISDNGAIKKILVTGFIVFALSSLVCGLSQSIMILLAARAVQGVGSAMLAATGIMLAVKFIPIERRNLAMSLTVLGSSIGAAFGPALGGVLTEYLSWHWIFFINVPIGIICAYFAIRAVPKDDPYSKGGFDIIGSILLFISLVCGLYTLESLPSEGFTAVSTVTLIVFAILFIIFIMYERRTPNPVLDLSLFRILRFDGAVIAFMILNVCFMGILYLMPFMLNIEMHYDTASSGMIMLIQAVVTLILCVPVGRMADIHGTRKLAIIGCLFLVATSILMAVTNNSTGLILVIIDLIFFGAVWGFGGGSIGPRLVETAPKEKAGSASSLLSFFVYFGSAMGTALFSALFNIGSGASGCSISDLAADVFMNGFVFTMIISAILASVAVILSWAVKQNE